MARSRSLCCRYFAVHVDAAQKFVKYRAILHVLANWWNASVLAIASFQCSRILPCTWCQVFVGSCSWYHCPAAYQQYISVCWYQPNDLLLL